MVVKAPKAAPISWADTAAALAKASKKRKSSPLMDRIGALEKALKEKK